MSRKSTPGPQNTTELPVYLRHADQLPEELWHDLIGRPVDEACQATGASHVEGVFHLPLFGSACRVNPKERSVVLTDEPLTPLSYEAGVILLTYLAKALDIPLANDFVSPQDMIGGRVFFQGPHAIRLGRVLKYYGEEPTLLLERAAAMGGASFAQGDLGASTAVTIPGLPRIPVHLLLWGKEVDRPARAVLGFDSRISFQMDLAAILGISNLMVRSLTGLPL